MATKLHVIEERLEKLQLDATRLHERQRAEMITRAREIIVTFELTDEEISTPVPISARRSGRGKTAAVR